VQERLRKPAKCKARVAPEGFLAKKSEPRCNLVRDPSPFSDKHYSLFLQSCTRTITGKYHDCTPPSLSGGAKAIHRTCGGSSYVWNLYRQQLKNQMGEVRGNCLLVSTSGRGKRLFALPSICFHVFSEIAVPSRTISSDRHHYCTTSPLLHWVWVWQKDAVPVLYRASEAHGLHAICKCRLFASRRLN
jgi:hypothetical protein